MTEKTVKSDAQKKVSFVSSNCVIVDAERMHNDLARMDLIYTYRGEATPVCLVFDQTDISKLKEIFK